MKLRIHFRPTFGRIFLAAAACWWTGSVFAAGDLPKHLVLVYADARPTVKGLDKEDYCRLAAFVDREGKPTDTLFDGFLILGLKAKSGDGLVPGFGSPNRKEDFDWFLDHVFDEGKQIANLEEAVESLPSGLRKPKQIILAIPYPSETHSREARHELVSHFVSEAARRFEQGHFNWLHLTGFYWLDETISGPDSALVKDAAQIVHAGNFKFYWIPYFNASGQLDWRICGFDCAMLQPNYAFRNVKTNRFDQAEAKRQKQGMTIEMEIARYTRNRPESPAWKASFLKYLSAGLQHEWASLDNVGYYNGNDLVTMSRQPQEYPYYELVHKFIRRTLSQEDVEHLASDAAAETAGHGATGPVH